MILMINKFHRVEAGETASSVKIDKPTEVEAWREAKKQECQLAANYMADSSVIDWTLCIYEPKTMRIHEPLQYFSPVVDVVEEPTDPTVAE